MKQKKYYLGLDIGTNSVGWAVTDEDYNLCRFKQKDMWGIRLFENADTASERRVKRANRRRLQRRKQRIKLLQELFAEEVNKVDSAFFQRLNESNFQLEDKTLGGMDTLFHDKDYTDRDYHEAYPTIFHLRKELLQSREKHDVRLIYLAIHHIIKNRGHFLLNGDLESVSDFTETYRNFINVVESELKIEFSSAHINEAQEILCETDVSKSERAKKLEKTLKTAVENKEEFDEKYLKNALSHLCKFMVGNKGDFVKLIGEDIVGMEKTSFSFAETDYDQIRADLEDNAPQWCCLIDTIKTVHDWSILANILNGEQYISLAKVKQYDKHKRNLKVLRKLVLKYADKGIYNEIFNDRNKKDNYCHYVGSVKINGKKYSLPKCKQTEDFYKYLGKTLNSLNEKIEEEDRELYENLMQEIKNQTLLPLQVNRDNGVIPYQVHKAELEIILENAGEYLNFLDSRDEDGISIKEKILSLLTFRVPYYVGPLSNRHKDSGANVWIVRKEEGHIYPWNFDEKVDREKSNEAFIARMTNKCTYLVGEDVLPKNSLLYSKYMVLNELNNLRIRGKKISEQLKKQIYNDLFKKHAKVTGKRLRDYLNANGYDLKPEDLSGFDQDFKTSLSSYLDFQKNIFGDRMEEDKIQSMVEDIIKWATIYGDDGRMLKAVIEKEYPDQLSKEQIKKIQMFRYSGWGNFSRKFLNGIEGVNKETGEVSTIIGTLWNTNSNLMQILSDEFTFRKEIADYNAQQQGEIKKIDYDHLVKDLYVSPANKRAIWQTIQIAEEIKNIMGHAPEKIFIEMARGTEEKQKNKRTVSRKDQLLSLYESCKEDVRNWTAEISEHEERDFRSMKLFLYYTQQGRCMYTGEPIDLDMLMSQNSLWDRDHIYPQSRIKDDSIDNLVLVNKTVNSRKSADLLSPAVQAKMRPFWKMLLENKFISKKKYERLTRTADFNEEELTGFISRQLVETRQATKAVADLFGQMYKKEGTEVIYVKAGLVSQFRQRDLKMMKSRRINDYHHAKDAYLNIVVGNVYNARFTSNPLNWIRENKDTNYSINAVFRHDVKRGKQCVWKASQKGSTGTVEKVRDTMRKNTVLYTEYSYCEKGKLFDENIVGKNEGASIPIKKGMPVHKYGGYKSPNTSYFAQIEFDGKKGERVRQIAGVPIYVANMLEHNPDALIRYFEETKQLNNVTILRDKIKKNALLIVNGYPMRIRGENAENNQFKSNVQLVLNEELQETVRLVEKYLEKNKDYNADEKFDGINDEQMLTLYDTFIDKFSNSIYSRRPSKQTDKLEKGRVFFASLTLGEKAAVINEILNMFRCDIATTSNLTMIQGTSKAGSMAVKKNTIGKSKLHLVNQSVTGLFENRIRL